MQRKQLAGSSSEFRNECLTKNFAIAYAVSEFQTLISHSETKWPIFETALTRAAPSEILLYDRTFR